MNPVVPRPTPRTVLVSTFVALALTSAASAAPGRRALDLPLVVTQVPLGAKAPPAGWDKDSLGDTDWYRGARLVVVAPQGEERVLSAGFESACDPNVSFDGQHVLFAGRRQATDRWRIWEIGLDGQGARPVSPENLEARHPIYVSTLFTLNSPEPWFTTVFVGRDSTVNELGRAAASSLYNVKLDGGELRRLTFNPNLDTDPFQTWDGRVIYAAERYPSEPGTSRGRFGLYAVHTEGADMEFYGGELGRRIQRMPCATAGGLVVFVESDQPNWDGAGQLGSIEARRPHLTYRPLTKGASHVYLHPQPLEGNAVLVARRDARGKETWGIYRFDADSGTCERVFDAPGFHDVQAVVAQAHRRPDGHSTTVTTQHDFGVLYGLSAYTTDAVRTGHIAPGEIKRVRLIEGVAPRAGQSGAEATASGPIVTRRLLGEAPVQPDGSFSLEVPADTPLLLQTLDERGLALGTCGWIWVKPKENRGCIGCHEDPERVPENQFVQALHRPPNRLQIPVVERRVISYREHVAPILQQHCSSVGCHDGSATTGRLRFPPPNAPAQALRLAYEALLAPADGKRPDPRSHVPVAGRYVDPGRARTSWLVWQLSGADTSRVWDRGTAKSSVPAHKVTLMPPAGKAPPLSPEEIQTVIQWIDMGAQFDAPQANPTETTQGARAP